VEHVHRYYVEQGPDLSRLCLVFGGRRPELFIKKDLARRIGKAFVPPRFFTIDEWMAYVAFAGQVPASGSDLEHGYTIYQLAQTLCPWVCQGRATLRFFTVGQGDPAFIEQLDLEDVPSGALTHLKENAEIGFNVPEDINKLLMHLGGCVKPITPARRAAVGAKGYRYLQASRRVNACDLSAFDEILFCNFFICTGRRIRSSRIFMIGPQRCCSCRGISAAGRRWGVSPRLSDRRFSRVQK